MTDIESCKAIKEGLYALRKRAHGIGLQIDGTGDEFTPCELELAKAKAVMDIIESLTMEAAVYIDKVEAICEEEEAWQDEEWQGTEDE